MRIVLTGCNGRVGRAIHARLAPAHDIVAVDRTPSSLVNVLGDICDAELMHRAMQGADAVIHVAALHAPHVGVHPDAEFERVNVAGTRAVLAAARRHGVRRFVFTSTTALYGHASSLPDGAAWIDEATSPRPRTIYHRTKLGAEALLNAAAEDGAIDVRIIRMSRCFPEPAPLMAVYRLHRGVDARDVAEAHALALVNGGARTQTYVVSGSAPFAREDGPDLLRAAPDVLRRRAPDVCRAFAERGWALPLSIDRVYRADLARRALGWAPRHGFAEVLAQLDAGDPEVLPPDARGDGDD